MSLCVLTYYNRNDEIARANFQKSVKKFQKDYKLKYLVFGSWADTVSCGAFRSFQLRFKYTGFKFLNVKKI